MNEYVEVIIINMIGFFIGLLVGVNSKKIND